MAAITSFHPEKCCHLVNEHEASAGAYAAASVSFWYIVHTYLFNFYGRPLHSVNSDPIFTARCTIVQSAVLRLHGVRPSVTLEDQDHIGWKSWKLTARTISPTPSLFVAQRPSTYSQGTWGNFEETRGGAGKSGMLSTKATISVKRVKAKEKLLWSAYRNHQRSFERYHPRPTTVSSFPRLGFATPPKTPMAIISKY